jgi:predicted nucleic acid-binding protein
MPYLCDTSILLRLAEPENPIYKDVESAIDILGSNLVMVPQVLYEYWVVATRPKSVNGQGLASFEAKFELDKFEELFTLFHDTDSIYSIWKNLIAEHKVMGKTSHDARLVAAMKVHRIDSILTLNPKDFQRFDHINVVMPADI